MPRKTVVIGLVGVQLDSLGRASTSRRANSPRSQSRWDRWRPSVGLTQHDDLVVDRFELLLEPKARPLGEQLLEDIRSVSPETAARVHQVRFRDPWDFAEVFEALSEWAENYSFDEDNEDYLVHITTGTHVAQICWYLLTESRRVPAKLLQTSPPTRGRGKGDSRGSYKIIDLDLSRYDAIAARFERERRDAVSFLKAGIETRNTAFNALMDRIEEVALASNAPVLLTGPTGVGKTRLAGRIYELKHKQRRVGSAFVEVNCATLRGDGAMSALFGHEKGAFTGAAARREGLLRAAHDGLLFLDEIGELGLDEQAMLLRAIEEGTFFPVGADRAVQSSFQLIAGTNRDLAAAVERGEFREDLLARINLWTFDMPALRDRVEDLEPNLDYELARIEQESGRRVTFNREARALFLAFAVAPTSAWSGNFRDLSAAVTRMTTLAKGGRINVGLVEEETERLQRSWGRDRSAEPDNSLSTLLDPDTSNELDRFDRVQLADVVDVCRTSSSLSDAGRKLFAASRRRKTSSNDSTRLSKYLARFGIRFADLR